MKRAFFQFVLLIALPTGVCAEGVDDCKKSSEALAPAQRAWAVCESDKNVNACVEAAVQLFEIGITALEKCGPVDPQAICRSVGDVRQVCTNEAQCQRAKVAWNAYCAKLTPGTGPDQGVQPNATSEGGRL